MTLDNISYFQSPTKTTSSSKLLTRGDEVNVKDMPLSQLFNCRLSQEIEYMRKLFITKTHIIQLVPSRSKPDTFIVLGVNNLSALSKLKFKKTDGKFSMIFNNNERVNYYVENVNDCIALIQKAMSINGIQGSPTNKAQKASINSKKIETAEKMFDAVKKLVNEFDVCPNIHIVLHVMDLLRESAERFSEANNNKYQEVINFIKTFLQKAEVISLLDNESKNRINNNDNNNSNNETEPNTKLRKINFEDVDTSCMEKNLVDYNDDDDENDDDFRTRQKFSIDSNDTELRNMLSTMDDEFSNLLSTFSNPTNISGDDDFDEGVGSFDLNELDILLNEKDDMSESFIYKT